MKFLKKNFLFLAPMSGFSNGACRKLSREYGADGTLSEFVHSRAVLLGAGRVLEKMRFDESERPYGIQIFGSDAGEMAEAAALIEERLAPDFVDVNFGCPAHTAVDGGAGSALLKNVPQMCEIIRRVAAVLRRSPVSAKMRTGWDSNSIVVPDAALALRDAGAQMITLHGRTKTQGYDGNADWNLIEKTARSLKIPLVGNGSVEKLGGKALAESACAGFMIGRAALGNPWIFRTVKSRIENPDAPAYEPSPAERAKLALRYADMITSGEYTGIDSDNLKHAQVQIMRFLKGAAGFKKLRIALKNVLTVDELKKLLCEIV